jgi:hypothetical protein
MLAADARGASYSQECTLTPFNLFVHRHKDRLQLENPDCSAIEICQKIAAAWACLSPEDKMAYYDDSYEKFPNYGTFPFDDPSKARSTLPDSSNLGEAIVHAALQISSLEQPQDPGGYLSWLGGHVVRKYYAEHHDLPQNLIVQFNRGMFATLRSSNELAEMAGSLNLRSMIGGPPNS